MRNRRTQPGTAARNSIERQVKSYLRTGDHDPTFAAWSGDHILARCRSGSRSLADALVAEVSRRAQGHDTRGLRKGIELKTFARAKVGPMVTGLFPSKERDVILDLLESSLVFLSEAVAARNGWKRILSRCASPKRIASFPSDFRSSSNGNRTERNVRVRE